MSMADVAARLTGMAKNFANIDLKIERLERDLRDLRGETSGVLRDLRNEIAGLQRENGEMRTRLAVLEEARNTTRETVRAEITAAVAELRVRYAEAQAQARTNPENFLQLPPAKDNKAAE